MPIEQISYIHTSEICKHAVPKILELEYITYMAVGADPAADLPVSPFRYYTIIDTEFKLQQWKVHEGMPVSPKNTQ